MLVVVAAPPIVQRQSTIQGPLLIRTPVAVPAKRPTTDHDAERPRSPPPSPPNAAKRSQALPSPRKAPELSTDFTTCLDPFFIAHSEDVQRLLDARNLSWGTIYEIARGVTKGQWEWSSVTAERLDKLRGTNTEAAHKVSAVMQGRDVPRSRLAFELWAEYDREQDAILENKGRGLGGMGPWKGKEGWYGGRIQQVGRLQKVKGKYSIQLEKPEIRRSHRFSRFLGSRRILQVRVADDLLYKHGDDVRALLCSSKFILCGRVFVPFHAKEGSMYMMETSQDHQRMPSPLDGDQFRISLKEFVDWHNPLRFNSGQPISKWSTRWALGLSTSVPTLEFEAKNIFFIADECEGGLPSPAEKVFTDGCGWINGSALTQIMRLMKYGSRPTA
ncbi:hypothetical protein HYDPIDRAFT_86612, partial [Hydnomerulius pinastri MD-312]